MPTLQVQFSRYLGVFGTQSHAILGIISETFPVLKVLYHVTCLSQKLPSVHETSCRNQIILAKCPLPSREQARSMCFIFYYHYLYYTFNFLILLYCTDCTTINRPPLIACRDNYANAERLFFIQNFKITLREKGDTASNQSQKAA